MFLHLVENISTAGPGYPYNGYSVNIIHTRCHLCTYKISYFLFINCHSIFSLCYLLPRPILFYNHSHNRHSMLIYLCCLVNLYIPAFSLSTTKVGCNFVESRLPYDTLTQRIWHLIWMIMYVVGSIASNTTYFSNHVMIAFKFVVDIRALNQFFDYYVVRFIHSKVVSELSWWKWNQYNDKIIQNYGFVWTGIQ